MIGVADHCGWAVLVTVADGALIDRRRVQLVDPGLPTMPHHGEGQRLPLAEAIALVERVQASAERCAGACLDVLAADLNRPCTAIALRRCMALPETIAERITNYRAQTAADGVMYRMALAAAAEARGMSVDWYDAKRVMTDEVRDRIDAIGKKLGPPWQKDHRTAMAAALAVTSTG